MDHIHIWRDVFPSCNFLAQLALVLTCKIVKNKLQIISFRNSNIINQKILENRVLANVSDLTINNEITNVSFLCNLKNLKILRARKSCF